MYERRAIGSGGRKSLSEVQGLSSAGGSGYEVREAEAVLLMSAYILSGKNSKTPKFCDQKVRVK